MQLTLEGLQNKEEWISKGYQLPQFDIVKMKEETKAHPTWIHFGAGNIFRAFQANLAQKLLNEGLSSTGIISVDGHDYEIAKNFHRPHDNLTVLVTLKADGSVEKTVIGSIAEACIMDGEDEKEFGRMKEIFSNPSLQLASFTITEKGYALKDSSGNYKEEVKKDFETGPKGILYSYIGKVCALLYTRYLTSKAPMALVSMDNISQNGTKLHDALMEYASVWKNQGEIEEGFLEYLNDPSQLSFPWTMIDKITPRPDDSVKEMLQKDGLDLTPGRTARNTFIAPYVNAEESEYLVVEDAFPNGRPPLEKAGVIFTDRHTVTLVERMKVTACLNPLHTALAIYGCLLGYTKISEEMKDEDLSKLVQILGYKEDLPVVESPKILDPKDFMDTVVDKRIPNPFMPDTPQRIATDTSQKLSVRYGETIKKYVQQGNVQSLRMIPLVQAGWLRYLMAIDDEGTPFELSPDPLLDEVCPYVEGISLDAPLTDEQYEKVKSLLTNVSIFGVDLKEVGLADTVMELFTCLCQGKGAIRKTLHAKVSE